MMSRQSKPFVSDGCSFWPDGNWHSCCFEHDMLYHRGGSPAERKEADRLLYECVKATAGPVMAYTMWVGVRVFGHQFMPSGRFRWGYGYKWPRARPPHYR